MKVENREGAQVKYDIPAWAKSARCRSCDAMIYFVRTPKGKNMPVDPDGTPHWATCPGADEFRR